MRRANFDQLESGSTREGVVILPRTAHKLCNTGADPLVLLCCCAAAPAPTLTTTP
jgi:hypothetical protein